MAASHRAGSDGLLRDDNGRLVGRLEFKDILASFNTNLQAGADLGIDCDVFDHGRPSSVKHLKASEVCLATIKRLES